MKRIPMGIIPIAQDRTAVLLVLLAKQEEGLYNIGIAREKGIYTVVLTYDEYDVDKEFLCDCMQMALRPLLPYLLRE